jgi:hypothetical protein
MTTIEVTRTKRQIATIGITMDRIDTVVDVTSSAILAGTFPAPPVATATAGRTARDLTACTLPEINKPAIMARTGFT